jgi:isoleucyl-tRNA synthetase
LWIAGSDYRYEMSVSDEILKRSADAYRRVRNTARFLLSNLDGFDPAQDLVAPQDLLALDRWVVDRAWQLQQDIIDAYDNYHFQVIYQKILNFCSIDLGGFYLDIIKDRQYTAKRDGLARRSAQTAMYHVIEALVRWLAPITSYTADEIWAAIPGQRGASVFLETWYQALLPIDTQASISRVTWDSVMATRTAVSKQLEQLRSQGAIGASLNAEVALFAAPELYAELGKLAGELHFVFITSSAEVAELSAAPADAVATELDGLKIKVSVSEHGKCVRCWHQRADVGQYEAHPELCGRCVENIDGPGEVRRYA